MQGCTWSQLSSDDKKIIFVRDSNKTFVVSSFRHNLISSSSFDKISLYQNSNVVGSGSLIDNLYMLDV
ncbi:hypothetical protein CR513_33017, partial [Mucuna pruriens]